MQDPTVHVGSCYSLLISGNVADMVIGERDCCKNCFKKLLHFR